MKFESLPVEEHAESPLADDGQLEATISRWSRRPDIPEDGVNACFVASISDATAPEVRQAQLHEILSLTEAQGDRVVGHRSYRIRRPNPRTLIGRGTYDDLAERARDAGANMLVLDAELSPSQTRNLEEATAFPICDREAVILNVFQRHARSRRARIQVEVAHLEFLRPRIRGVGLTMDQQAGGVMGSRGPGETASELLARRIDRRLQELRRAFARLEEAGEVQRQGRGECQRIVLLGYTNAGKTTLMNGLTAAGLSAKDQPFETLDTTSRALSRHGNDVLLSDTVGFIRRLPDRLLASFESTLAEAKEASLLVLVVDVSDPEWEEHLEITQAVLARLGVETRPRYYVFNKTDRVSVALPEDDLSAAAGESPWIAVSGCRAEDMDTLRTSLLAHVRRDERTTKLFVPYAASHLASEVYRHCRVLDVESSATGTLFSVSGTRRVVMRLQKACMEVRS